MSDFVHELQDAMIRNFEMPQKTLIESYHRYPSYYDHKATAKPLEREREREKDLIPFQVS